MKHAALSLLVLIACLALWFLGGGGTDTRGELTLVDPATAEEPLAAQELEARLVVPDEVQVDEGRVPVGESAEPATTSEPLFAVARRTIRGRVLLVEENGMERVDLDGHIHLVRWSKKRGEVLKLKVVHGAFEIDPEGMDSFSFREAALEGREAWIEDPYRQHSPELEEVEVRAFLPRTLTLHVVDQTQDEPLHDVTLVLGDDRTSVEGREHPGEFSEASVTFVHAPSPLVIEPRAAAPLDSLRTYYAHSPGMAWRSIQLDLARGGERFVRLEPGGDLEVRVRGEELPADCRLRVYSRGGGTGVPYADVSCPVAGVAEVRGLAPGAYRVTVEVGDWFRKPRVHGEAEVNIVAGARQIVELELLPPPEVQTGQLIGTVTIPSAWKFESFVLAAAPPGISGFATRIGSWNMVPLGSDGETWSFDFGELPAAYYGVEISSSNFPGGEVMAHLALVQADQVTHLEFVLPPPTAVRIRFVDAGTSEPAALHRMHWGVVGEGVGNFGPRITVQPKEGARGVFEFTAPAGRLNIGAFGSGYTSIQEDVTVGPGFTELTLEVARDCPLKIVFLDGDTTVPSPESWWPAVEHLDGEGSLLYKFNGGSWMRIGLSQPGRYRFEMPGFEDYEPIPDQVITVTRGEATVHEVHLVRKP